MCAAIHPRCSETFRAVKSKATQMLVCCVDESHKHLVWFLPFLSREATRQQLRNCAYGCRLGVDVNEQDDCVGLVGDDRNA